MNLRSHALALLLPLAACGCTSLAGMAIPFAGVAKKEPVRADAKNPAIEVACLWQPGEGRNDKGVPCRGFSGQVFFFTRKDAEPVLAEGEVRVYVFADQGTSEERSTPLHQYDFEAPVWDGHATMTSLGPGYSLFIPYPGQDPHQVRCHLRVRFTPKQGPAIYSDNVTITLEGPPRPGDASRAPTPTVATAELVHRRGTLSELRNDSNGGSSTDAAPRQLRTQTFRLDGRGGIMPASHEEPAAAGPHPLTAPASPAHPLGGTAPPSLPNRPPGAARPAGATHPLEGSSAGPHPLSSSAAPGEPAWPTTNTASEPVRLAAASPARSSAGPIRLMSATAEPAASHQTAGSVETATGPTAAFDGGWQPLTATAR